MTTFTLVRHGTPLYPTAEEWRLKGAASDWLSLSAQGIAELEQTAVRLEKTPATLILSSPMTRALHTAAILSRGLDLPLAVEFGLDEPLPDVTPSPERLRSFRGRLEGALDRYTDREHVIVACHGAVIAALTGESVPCGEISTFQLERC